MIFLRYCLSRQSFLVVSCPVCHGLLFIVLTWLLTEDVLAARRHIDSPSFSGLTPLHLAVMAGSQACVEALSYAGASMLLRSNAPIMSDAGILPAGSTPLHAAVQHGDIAIIYSLLQVCLLQLPQSIWHPLMELPTISSFCVHTTCCGTFQAMGSVFLRTRQMLRTSPLPTAFVHAYPVRAVQSCCCRHVWTPHSSLEVLVMGSRHSKLPWKPGDRAS